jgi:hypothetical protein
LYIADGTRPGNDQYQEWTDFRERRDYFIGTQNELYNIESVGFLACLTFIKHGVLGATLQNEGNVYYCITDLI